MRRMTTTSLSTLFLVACILLSGSAQLAHPQALSSRSSNVLASSSNTTSTPMTYISPNNNITSRSFRQHQHSHTGPHLHRRTLPPIPMTYQKPHNHNQSHSHEEHEKAAATSIFRNLLLLSPSKVNKTNELPVSPELTFHDGQTIATIYTNLSTNLVHCNLIEVNTPEESDRVLNKFFQQKRRVQKTNFRTILAIITACQALDPEAKEIKRKRPNSFPFASTTYRNNNLESVESTDSISPALPQSPVGSPSDMWTVISGILPGTKWCGLGDIAKDYDDLGSERSLDKCCRAHDHCPTKLKALRSGYGLVNWSFYTKSHCECDALLFDCLKKAPTPTADMLGNFYFNILKVQCIEEEDPMKCTLFDDHTNQCRLWQPDLERNKTNRMLFRNIRREF